MESDASSEDVTKKGEIVHATFVVVGGGIAGFSCIESLSILQPDKSAILISATPVIKAVTNIVPLTKNIVQFGVEEKSGKCLTDIHPNLTIITDTVVKINSSEHTVVTTSNNIYKYDKLCLCTGAMPKVLFQETEYGDRVFGIRDTDSALSLQEKLNSARKVVIIGNGGIATELVYEIKGVEVVWIIKDRHMSAAFVDPGAAEFFKEALERKAQGEDGELKEKIKKRERYSVDPESTSNVPGAALGPDWHTNIRLRGCFGEGYKITVEYDTEVTSISNEREANSDEPKNDDDNESEEWPLYLTLSNGKMYGCDFIISATGVIPNSLDIVLEPDVSFYLADDKGIAVDDHMRTDITDIFAAGDVCTASWSKAPHWFQMRLWTQARQFGCYAARCMVGEVSGENVDLDFCFELFSHVTRFYGYKVVLLGLFNGQKLDNKYEILLRSTQGEEYVKFIVKDDKLQGAVLIGETDLEEMAENLILNQINLSEIKEELLNPNIDIEDYFD